MSPLLGCRRVYGCQPLAGQPEAYGEQNLYYQGRYYGQNGKDKAVAFCPPGLVISKSESRSEQP